MMVDDLTTPPEGHDAAILAATGCLPREALSGPQPPGWGMMARIAAPMLGSALPWHELASEMADSGATEWAWRDALLAFFPDEGDE